MEELPAIFISHGAPDLLLSQEPARQAQVKLGRILPHPKGILIISAHWQASQFTLGNAQTFTTIHDFYGFPAELYQLNYPAKGATWLTEICREALQESGVAFAEDQQRGLDHGAWAPLMLAWPEANIPVITLSLNTEASLQDNLNLGHALEALRHAGVLLITSGAITHNLKELRDPGSPPDPWAQEFTHWLQEKIASGHTKNLINYREQAPHAQRAHPTAEHLEPLLIAYGAGGERAGYRLHHSFSYGNLAMDIYAFGTGDFTELQGRMDDL